MTITHIPSQVAVWLSGNALALINVVAPRRARLVPGWVTVGGYTILVYDRARPTQPGYLSVGSAMSLGHR